MSTYCVCATTSSAVTHRNVYTRTHKHTHTCTFMHIHACIHTHTHVFIYKHIYIYIYTCTCIYIHIYIHTSIYLYIYIGAQYLKLPQALRLTCLNGHVRRIMQRLCPVAQVRVMHVCAMLVRVTCASSTSCACHLRVCRVMRHSRHKVMRHSRHERQ